MKLNDLIIKLEHMTREGLGDREINVSFKHLVVTDECTAVIKASGNLEKFVASWNDYGPVTLELDLL